MAVDINNPPPGGFQNGGWYWDPSAKQARQYWNGSFGGAGVINNPNQQGYGQGVSEETQRQSGYVGSVQGGSSSSSQSSSSSSSGGRPQMDPLQQVNQTIQDSFQKLQDEVTKRFGEYRAGKPFRVDEVLAEKRMNAKEQIDPYYDQMLGDYMTGVQRKINRGVDDTKQVLDELTASSANYEKNAQINLDNAVEQAQQGFAESGLLNSGAGLRAEGQIKENVGSNLDEYTRKNTAQMGQVRTNLNRNLEDINLEKKGYVSNLERNRFTDVENRASTLTKEAGQDYVRGFQASLPSQLQSSSGFDMLKSLGIYS